MKWPPTSELDAYGPELQHEDVHKGDRVTCWAGDGVIEHIGPTFNGVQGIHAYAGIRLDDGSTCSAKLDEIHTTMSAPAAPEGMLW